MMQDGIGMVRGAIRNEKDRVIPAGRMLGDCVGPGTSKQTGNDQNVTQRATAWPSDRSAFDDTRPWCLYVGHGAANFPKVKGREN